MPKVENPVLLDAPEHFETERLMVRVSRAGDGKIVYEAIMDSLPELKQWLPWAHKPQTLEGTETLVRRDAGNFILREPFGMLIFVKESGDFVGRLSLHNIVWSVPAFEIGYWLRTSMAGKGYMTEAVHGLTDYTFTHFQAERMVINCDIRNTQSAAIPRRLGYVLEGTHRNDMREPDDTLSSGYVFTMLRDEWSQGHPTR